VGQKGLEIIQKRNIVYELIARQLTYLLSFGLSPGGAGGLGIAGHDLDSVHLGEVRVLTEFHLLQHEGPDVVTKAVRVEFIGFEVEFSFDPGVQCGVDGLVELYQHPEGEGRAEHLVLHQLVQTLLQGVAQGGVPVQLVRHY